MFHLCLTMMDDRKRPRHWDFLPLNSPFTVRVTHFLLAAKWPTLCCLQDCAPSLTPSTPFLYFSTPGSIGHRCALTAALRVSWDLSDPAEALKTSQRAAVRPTIWPPPPPTTSASPTLRLHAYQRAHSHPSAQFETRGGTWWFTGPQCRSKTVQR